MTINKRDRARYALVLQEALDAEIGIKIETNDAARLQMILGQARVDLRKEGIHDYDSLQIRQIKIVDESSEQVFITKKLTPEQVVAIMQREKKAGDS